MRDALRTTAYRRDRLWRAALIHRLSGVALALFLPLHFLLLGLALDGAARLDGAIRWTDAPVVKLAEIGLVFLLAVHLLGGLRILLIENLAWRDDQRRMAGIVVVIAAAIAFAFILSQL